jgi:hypothetical protein
LSHFSLPTARLRLVTAPEYAYEGQLIRVEDGVLELFSRTVLGSLRLPLGWVSARLQPQKHDTLLVEIGTTDDPSAPFFAPPAIRNAAFNFQIPSSEEARLRGFLEDAARSVGRTI